MSGGGGGGDWRPPPKRPTGPTAGPGKGGDGPVTDDPCAITEHAIVNSVDRAILAHVAVGDILTLDFVSGPPKQLLVRTDAGDVLGSITSAKMPQIIACIQAGNAYLASVLSINGAICTVEIERR